MHATILVTVALYAEICMLKTCLLDAYDLTWNLVRQATNCFLARHIRKTSLLLGIQSKRRRVHHSPSKSEVPSIIKYFYDEKVRTVASYGG